MLRPRIIPCLLVHNKGLVKTVRFRDPKYVGDPINAVKIFNEKEVDELLVLDIDATARAAEPDYVLIRKLAAECRMPLCYGGGITSVEQASRIIGLGVEKVALSAAVIRNKQLITALAQELGSQSVVVVLDAKRKLIGSRWETCIVNGTVRTGISPIDFAQEAQALGAGEIVVNSIDRDGTMEGYDMELVDRIAEAITVPLTVLGGAGSMSHLQALVERVGIIGAGAGSLFVFKGPYKAVLINYPAREERERLAGLAIGAR